MKEHYNLYYLLREDKGNHPMSPYKKRRIRRYILRRYRKLRAHSMGQIDRSFPKMYNNATKEREKENG